MADKNIFFIFNVQAGEISSQLMKFDSNQCSCSSELITLISLFKGEDLQSNNIGSSPSLLTHVKLHPCVLQQLNTFRSNENLQFPIMSHQRPQDGAVLVYQFSLHCLISETTLLEKQLLCQGEQILSL